MHKLHDSVWGSWLGHTFHVCLWLPEVWQGCLARAGGGSTMARTSSAWILDVLNGSGLRPAGLVWVQVEPVRELGSTAPICSASYCKSLAPR